MCTEDEFLRKARIVNDKLKETLNRKSISFKWHTSDISVLEGLLARRDRRLSDLLMYVYEHGGIYDAWSEFHDANLWKEAIEKTGVDLDFYISRTRNDDEIFPWDNIDIGVSKKFLLNEWHKAEKEEVTPNCREKCAGCGAASFGGGVCFES